MPNRAFRPWMGATPVFGMPQTARRRLGCAQQSHPSPGVAPGPSIPCGKAVELFRSAAGAAVTPIERGNLPPRIRSQRARPCFPRESACWGIQSSGRDDRFRRWQPSRNPPDSGGVDRRGEPVPRNAASPSHGRLTSHPCPSRARPSSARQPIRNLISRTRERNDTAVLWIGTLEVHLPTWGA